MINRQITRLSKALILEAAADQPVSNAADMEKNASLENGPESMSPGAEKEYVRPVEKFHLFSDEEFPEIVRLRYMLGKELRNFAKH